MGGEIGMESIPRLIEILFKNNTIEYAKALVIIHLLMGKRSKIKVKEYVYYRIMSEISEEKERPSKESRYIFFSVEEKLPNILLYLATNEYINISSEQGNDILELDIRLLDKGRNVSIQLQSIYYEQVRIKLSQIKEKGYSEKKYKKMVESINGRN